MKNTYLSLLTSHDLILAYSQIIITSWDFDQAKMIEIAV